MTSEASACEQEPISVDGYAAAIAEYSETHGEAALYRASLLSRAFIERGLGPEDIVALHSQAFARACEGTSDRERLRLSTDSLEFLLEVMIAYGVQHAEYLELKARDSIRQAEAESARHAAQQAHRLQVLSDAALGHLSLDRLLDELIGRVCDILEADTVVVLLRDHDHLVVRAAVGVEVERGWRIPMAGSLVGRIASHPEPLIITDVIQEEIVRPTLRARGLHSILGAPLTVEGHVTGVIHVGTVERREFTDADARFLQVVADRLALAIDRASLYERVVDHEGQLQMLVGRLLATLEDERRRIAYDVHDGVAQVAASAYHHLQAFADDFPPEQSAAQEELTVALNLARRTVTEARRVIAGLRPAALDDLGLAAALRLELDALLDDGRQVTYDEELGSERLPATLETTLFRVAQEALTNIRKHAGSTPVLVALQRHEHAIRLEVRDWGAGFVLAPDGRISRGEQVGLSAMHERMALVGGTCAITSQPGAGTRVMVEAPVPVSHTNAVNGRG
jgi:signal transduction histidine kinase